MCIRDSVSIVATGEKCIVYVNSRDQAQALTRTLRRRVPEAAGSIAFYHAGLAREDRARVEGAFRDGPLACIVSTSAFGEGVNLPDVRHVVLYHMPFGSIEFNQMSGRAGRDGQTAQVHLLYSARDARINERLLDVYKRQLPARAAEARRRACAACRQPHGACRSRRDGTMGASVHIVGRGDTCSLISRRLPTAGATTRSRSIRSA